MKIFFCLFSSLFELLHHSCRYLGRERLAMSMCQIFDAISLSDFNLVVLLADWQRSRRFFRHQHLEQLISNSLVQLFWLSTYIMAIMVDKVNRVYLFFSWLGFLFRYCTEDLLQFLFFDHYGTFSPFLYIYLFQ